MKESILITGADAGLGQALAAKFHDEGHLVFAGLYRPGETAGVFAGGNPRSLIVFPLDVTDPESVHAGYLHVAARTDALDILINNAGICLTSDKVPLEESELQDGHLEKTMQVNAFGPLRVTRQFLPLLDSGGRKLIINISSEAGSIADCTRTSMYGYTMSKAALNMQSKILQNALGPRGYKILAVHPGWMQTRMGGTNATIDPAETAAGIHSLIRHTWIFDDPIYMDYGGTPLNW